MLGWQDDRALTEVLAKKDAAAFKRAFGYTTCGELLSHYPRDYIRHNKDVGLGGAEDGDHVTITGVIEEARVKHTSKAMVFILYMDNGVQASFFNAHYVQRVLGR